MVPITVEQSLSFMYMNVLINGTTRAWYITVICMSMIYTILLSLTGYDGRFYPPVRDNVILFCTYFLVLELENISAHRASAV